MSENLAQAFVELATVYDWDDLPSQLQQKIIDAATALEDWASTPVIVIDKDAPEPKKVVS